MNRLILDALQCRNFSRPPVWLMRQAGRYMPEYQAVRKKHSLLDLFKNSSLITEITLQPIHILGVDAAILFSDILIILEAFGVKVDFKDGVGPVIEKPLTPDTVDAFIQEDISDRLGFVFDAIKALKKELKVPLLGFAGAPFTIATYLIEGGTSKDFKKTKAWLYSNPSSFSRLLDKLAVAIAKFLDLQAESGVDAVQLFDSWASILGYHEFKEFSLASMKKVLENRTRKDVPIILFTRSSSLWASELMSLKPQGISVDWNLDLKDVRTIVGPNVALQGNLDPACLYGTHQSIKLAVDRLLASMHGDPGFIFNLGHGMLPDIPVDNVKFMVNYIKELKK